MIPAFLFFLLFFIAFSFLELLLIYLLNRWAAGHAPFVIDRLIRFELHHKKILRRLAWGSLLVISGLMLWGTPLLGVLRSATPPLRWFSGGLFGVLFLIYFTMTRRAARLAFEKRLHLYLYTVISLFFYTFMVILADQMYGSYQEWVQSQFIAPAVKSIEQTVDRQKESALLDRFRLMARAGGCPAVDFRQESGSKHFVFITVDTDLIASDYRDGTDLSLDFSGRQCTDSENTFLLKQDGSWYWVIASPEAL